MQGYVPRPVNQQSGSALAYSDDIWYLLTNQWGVYITALFRSIWLTAVPHEQGHKAERAKKAKSSNSANTTNISLTTVLPDFLSNQDPTYGIFSCGGTHLSCV